VVRHHGRVPGLTSAADAARLTTEVHGRTTTSRPGRTAISVDNAAGYFEPNELNRNSIPIMDGWNHLVRLYRPRREVLDGTWTVPSLEASR